jgi:hypothetical protein
VYESEHSFSRPKDAQLVLNSLLGTDAVPFCLKSAAARERERCSERSLRHRAQSLR